jgi:hypothetical protein
LLCFIIIAGSSFGLFGFLQNARKEIEPDKKKIASQENQH